MKAQTLANRIADNLCKKNGEIAVKYQDVIRVLLGERYHGRSYRGKGNFIHTADGRHYSTIEGLRLIGVDFTTGNDAKFGGKSGDYVELTPKGKRQVAEWVRTHNAGQSAITKKFMRVIVSLNDSVKNYECLKHTPYDHELFRFEKWTGNWCGFHWDAAQYKVKAEYVDQFVSWFKERIGADVEVK